MKHILFILLFLVAGTGVFAQQDIFEGGVKGPKGGADSTTASNGVSLSGKTVQLGNVMGATSAQLTRNTEIPLNGKKLAMTGNFPYFVIGDTTSKAFGTMAHNIPFSIVAKGSTANNNTPMIALYDSLNATKGTMVNTAYYPKTAGGEFPSYTDMFLYYPNVEGAGYNNLVHSRGWNVGVTGRIDNAMPAMRENIELKYEIPLLGKSVEWWRSAQAINGKESRFEYYIAGRDSLHESRLFWEAEGYEWRRSDNTATLAALGNLGTLNIYGSAAQVAILKNANGSPVFSARTGAGAVLPLINPNSDNTIFWGTEGQTNIFPAKQQWNTGRVDDATGVNILNIRGTNSFVGYLAGNFTSTGNHNNTRGRESGLSLTTGSKNIFDGYQAGLSVTTGSNNVYIGDETGAYNQATRSRNVFIGPGAGRYFVTEAGGMDSTLIVNGFDSYANLIWGKFSSVGRGRLGVNVAAAPTAQLQIGVGRTAANTAPFKFTLSGSALNTTPEAGAVEVGASDNRIYYTGSSAARNTLAYLTDSLNIGLIKKGAATTGQVATWNGTTWAPATNTSESTKIGVFMNSGTTPGISISTDSIKLHAATISTPGAVNTTAQVFSAGTAQKTISADNGFQLRLDDPLATKSAGLQLSESGGTNVMMQMTASSPDADNGNVQLKVEKAASLETYIEVGALNDKDGIYERGGLYEDAPTVITATTATLQYGQRNLLLNATDMVFTMQTIGTGAGETKPGRVVYFFNDNTTAVTLTGGGGQDIIDANTLSLSGNTAVTLIATTSGKWVIKG